jgi:uncharacterized protein YggT (Ycf19 family)
MRYEKQTTVVTEEKPESVGEKKVLIRANQIVWYIFDIIAFLLAFRVVLRALGASTGSGFTNFIYGITAPFVAPFRGIFPVISEGRFVIEWSGLVAIFVYLMVALAINYILDIMYPISDRDVK